MVFLKSLELSPSTSHIFKRRSADVMAGAATSQRTAAVPAKAPGAAKLSLSEVKIRGQIDRVIVFTACAEVGFRVFRGSSYMKTHPPRTLL